MMNPESYDVFEDISEHRNSNAWKHFLYNKVQNRSKCRHCNKVLSTGSGTKTMIIHLENDHKIEIEKKVKDSVLNYADLDDFEDVRNVKNFVTATGRNIGAVWGRNISRIWEHFHHSKSQEVAKCLHCGGIMKVANGKTSNLKKHLNARHNINLSLSATSSYLD